MSPKPAIVMVKTSVYVPRVQLDALRSISNVTFIPISRLIRQGIAHVITCYGKKHSAV